MPEIYDLDRTDASNNLTAKGGWPEGMNRSQVNNQARANLGAIRRWYQDPEWLSLLEEAQGSEYTVTKLTDTSIRAAASPAVDGTEHFPVGARIRVSVGGASAVEGAITSRSYISPNTDVVISFPASSKADEDAASGSGDGTADDPWTGYALVEPDTNGKPAVAGTVFLYDTSTHINDLAVRDNGAGVLVHPVDGNVGSINYTTGAITVNGLSEAFDSNVEIDYDYSEIVPAGCDTAEIFFAKSLGEAAFRGVGTAAGQIPLAQHLGSAAYKGAGPGNALDADTVDGKHAADVIDDAADAGKNYLINPACALAQRGLTIDASSVFPNNNDVYTLDQWLLLSDGNGRVDVTRQLDAPDGVALYSLRARASGITPGPAAEQFGFAQILEARDCAALLTGSQVVSLSFYGKRVGDIENLKTAILAWNSTRDTVTSDLVAPSGWNGAGYEPTWASNWTREGSVEDHVLGDAWARFTMENILIDTSGATNLAVFVWLDMNDFQVGDDLFLTGLKLERGPVATAYAMPDFAHDLMRAQRFFTKSFDLDTSPADNAGLAGAIYADTDSAQWRFGIPMFKAPTITTYNPGSGTAGAWNGSDAVPSPTNTGERSVTLDAASANDEIHACAEAVL